VLYIGRHAHCSGLSLATSAPRCRSRAVLASNRKQFVFPHASSLQLSAGTTCYLSRRLLRPVQPLATCTLVPCRADSRARRRATRRRRSQTSIVAGTCCSRPPRSSSRPSLKSQVRTLPQDVEEADSYTVSNRFHTPWLGLAIFGAWACLCALLELSLG
jgi:hypothetical protein